MAYPDMCFICDEFLDDGRAVKTVKKKGISSLIAKSKVKGDDKWKGLENLTEIRIHELCKTNYLLSKTKTSAPTATAVPAQQLFDFKIDCFLCGKPWEMKNKPGRCVVTAQLQEKISKSIDSRNDDWSREVEQRIAGSLLMEVHARYHLACYKQFSHISSTRTSGRPKLADLDAAFENVCRYMEESDDSQFSLSELMDKLEGWETTKETFKQKLRNKYGNDILIIEHPGKRTIVCFRNTGFKILVDSWYQRKAETEEEERLRVVAAAADIIREDIRSKVYDTSSYPAPVELLQNAEDDIPETLRVLLDKVMLKGKKNTGEKLTTKRDSIAHAIISVVRPRSFISSIQLATGVYLSRKFGSRMMIDVLNHLGTCASYTNISLYEASAIMNCETKFNENAYVQHVFDNADHNVCSLDGFSTFHSMGGICCVTPKSAINQQGPIKKLSGLPKAKHLASKINVPVVCCDRLNGNQSGLKSIQFLDVSQLNLGNRPMLPTAYALHLWAKFLKIDSIPSWRGFMETISHDSQYNVSQVLCLPFVNLPPSDKDTINTVLHCAATECLRLDQKTSFVTFDQPLYIKAREIVANDTHLLSDVIVRLGGFHLLMSFLGAVGTIMDGSGLKELFCTVYAGASVDNMLTGHAFSRAVRGHLLGYAALGSSIMKHATDVTIEDHQHITEMLNDFAIHPPTLQEINESEPLIEITTKTLKVMENLKKAGRTSQLWLQYFHCITLVMQFIEAERLGNWQLHLQCIRDMLPIFHAAGHLAYAKSAQIYLQDMSQLSSHMTAAEFNKFTVEGGFTIRRSDKKWAGIWTDMTVEQTLMRVMKIAGGLTHGRGVNKEGVIARWILGMPAAYEVIEQFESFCGVRSASSEQHRDWRPANLKRDTEDYLKFVEWFSVHDPFVATDPLKLMSIADGMCGGDAVNCDEAIEVGIASMGKMIGANAADVKLKRTTRVKSIATTKRGILIDNEVVAVNTTLLFQRIAAVTRNDSELATVALHHELAPFPLALFDDQGVMRKSKKSDLYTVFSSCPMNSIDLSLSKIVIDGGFLLHKVVWPLGSSYEQILQLYENYILRNYGQNVTVVFDGYSEADVGIKSYERLRRSKTIKCTQIVFEKDMTINVNQSKWLSNDQNKERLIQFLQIQLEDAGISVKQAAEDGDRLIVTTAIEELDFHEKVVVVGQDVDLLVLLIALTPEDREIHFLKEGSGKVSNTLFSTLQNENLKETILFSHAFTGCDTTSAVFQRGKKVFLKTLKNRPALQIDVAVFSNPNSSKDDIRVAGERLMLALHGAGENKISINDFRYERFVASAARFRTEVKLAQLPPTAGATEQHVWRVYYQVQKWLGNDQFDPKDWGWELKNNVFFPIMTEVAPAPQSILEMIFCNCKGNCSNRCGCRKAGLKCSSICSGCHGNSCSNAPEIDISSDTSESSDHSADVLLNQLDNIIMEYIDDISDEENDTLQEDASIVVEEDHSSQSDDEETAIKKRRLE